MNKRIAVFGSTGQLGTEFVEALRKGGEFDVIALCHADADVAAGEEVRRILNRTKPQIVVNCAAYVHVDACEGEPKNAFRVNAIGALNIARACAETGALCVYISSDYVFDGSKGAPYVESDSALPINVYGASKLAGEILVRQAAPRWLIVRTASLFGRIGAHGKGGNFIEAIIAKAKTGERLRVVKDVCMSPTYARDAAAGLVALVATARTGIVHLTNDGSCSWYELAKLVFTLTGIQAFLDPVSSAEYQTAAYRPKNSALVTECSLGKLRSWEDGLTAYLLEKGHMPAGGPAAHAG